jgi:3-deoxy-manno-octulosonate cytidylyltransferase (CMP-KDO synthetase)
MVTACTTVSLEEAKNSNCVKVVIDKNNFALYFSRSLIPFDRDKEGCEYLKHIGIYGYKREFLLKFTQTDESFLEKTEKLEQLRALENGYKIKVLKTDYNNISIDTEEDLILAEKIIKGDNK